MSIFRPPRTRQPAGFVPLNATLAPFCPGYFSGTGFGMWGPYKAVPEGSVYPRSSHGLTGYAGNGTTNCAVASWPGINLNTQPDLTFVLVYKKNAAGVQDTTIAGLGSTGGSADNTLLRFQGGPTTNAIRFQIQDSLGTIYSNTDSSDFGANDLRYHCVVVSGVVRSVDGGGGFQYYADGKKLNFAPSAVQSGTPASTLFDLATLLCRRRGGVTSQYGNFDVALFVPLIGVRQPDWWCQEISANPWQLFESGRRIWVPVSAAGGGTTVSVTGVQTTSALGSVVVQIPAATTVTGVQTTSALGSVVVQIPAATTVTGVQTTSALGSVSVVAAGDITVSGVQTTSALGSVSVVAGQVVSATGVQATSALGTATVSSATVAPVTGVQTTSALGSVSIVAGTVVAVAGLSASGALGSVTVPGSSTIVAVAGISCTGYIGQVNIGWTPVNPGSPSNWQPVNEAQSPNWQRSI